MVDPDKKKGATILVVDDEPENVLLMSGVLTTDGYATLSANSGAEALEILSAAAVRMFPAADYVDAAFTELLWLGDVGMFPAADYVDAAFDLALGHGGSLYDGIYLALARSLNAPVVTNDARLAAVARASHIRALMIGGGPPRLPRRSSPRSGREETY